MFEIRLIRRLQFLNLHSFVTVCERDVSGKDPDAQRRDVKSDFNEGGRLEVKVQTKVVIKINRGKSRNRVSENIGRGQGPEIQKHGTLKMKTKETITNKGEGLGN